MAYDLTYSEDIDAGWGEVEVMLGVDLASYWLSESWSSPHTIIYKISLSWHCGTNVSGVHPGGCSMPRGA